MKRIHLNAFKIAGVGHTAVGLWRHPDSQEHRYTQLDYWLETAKTLEEGKFDCLFLADFLGLPDIYGGSPDTSFREAISVPLDDPLLVVSAMATVTKRLGFAVTMSTTYEQPYTFARKMTTLDHLTDGRIGWNIVTSARASAARNLGLDQQVPHDERYAIADEFMSVLYKLWEGSWEDDAVVADREAGIYVDPAKVHAVAHAGKYYAVPDPYGAEPSRQRTPALFQAGSSDAGREFAATHAEGVFLTNTSVKGMRQYVDETREAAARKGRDPASLKFLAHISVVTAPTDAEAQAKYEDLIRYVSPIGTLARLAAWVQIDFSKVELDQPLKYMPTDGIRSTLERYTLRDPDRIWTPRQVAETIARALGGITIVGSPTTVADKMEELMEQGDIDGFNIADHMPLQTFPEFVALVVPELQRRGRVWKDYEGTTLRESLGVPGHPRLHEDHPGSSYRVARAP
jgi:FMN-dependent oxidoreductase (nitrilotriacetate monooxygenase family)